MKTSRIAAAIGLAKLAAVPHPATLGGVAHGLGKVVGGAIHAGARAGAGVAEAVGLPPALGHLVGGAVPVVAGVHGVNRAKQKFDNWRYQNGYYDPTAYGY